MGEPAARSTTWKVQRGSAPVALPVLERLQLPSGEPMAVDLAVDAARPLLRRLAAIARHIEERQLRERAEAAVASAEVPRYVQGDTSSGSERAVRSPNERDSKMAENGE